MPDSHTIIDRARERLVTIIENQDKEAHLFELRRIYILLLHDMAERTEVFLSSLFARVSYLAGLQSWNRQQKRLMHVYRRIAEGKEQFEPETEYKLAIHSLGFLLSTLGRPLEIETDAGVELLSSLEEEKARQSYKRIAFVQILERQDAGKYLIIDEDEAHTELTMDLAHKHNESLHWLDDVLGQRIELPVLASLHNVDVMEDGLYVPRSISLEPDYLFNVTDIAGAYVGRSMEPVAHLIKRYLPQTSNPKLVLGNVANYFLDQLIRNSQLSFETLFQETFQQYALSYLVMDERELRDIYREARHHYHNLRSLITETFPDLGITSRSSQVEPSFYSHQYGLQGRLDLLAVDPRNASSPKIVELKSGRPFMPNGHGIGNSHYVQTLLYDLLVRSISDHKQIPQNFILYSSLSERGLRSAPSIKQQQDEALMGRNLLFMQEYQMMLGKTDLLASSDEKAQHSLRGFALRDLQRIHATLAQLDAVEYSYFKAFNAFISRELYQNKIGEYGGLDRRGNSSLWRDSIEEKVERFEILSFLEIAGQERDGMDHMLELRLSPKSNRLSSFRSGDIAVLYPLTDPVQSAVKNQILKGSIIELSEEHIVFRLRHPQYYDQYFESHQYWNLEPDSLDTGYRRMYQGLFAWAEAPKRSRELMLGRRAPEYQDPKISYHWDERLTTSQRSLLHELSKTKDYRLVWGPPGTGKTSVILKHFVKYLYDTSQASLMLIAYTNRAVDEICKSLEEIQLPYLRIGSRYSTHPDHRGQLFQERVKAYTKRSEIRACIDEHRIIVGTLASIESKPEIFALKKIDTAIIDEASQILEPNLVGLLPRFRRSILIGDHLQLPAVVRQRSKDSKIEDDSLLKLGYRDCADSLFSRLIGQAREKFPEAILSLHEQGRMHQEIVSFPSEKFYQGTLRSFTTVPRLTAPLPDQIKSILPHRVVFIPVAAEQEDQMYKYNRAESAEVVNLVTKLLDTGSVTSEQIGIICPYKAQIAQIRGDLENAGLRHPDMTVDTVERYQGSARDYIILSTTVHRSDQIQQISSLTVDMTVDRKLNVALTRAREALIVIGNPAVLSLSPIYKSFIDRYQIERTTA